MNILKWDLAGKTDWVDRADVEKVMPELVSQDDKGLKG